VVDIRLAIVDAGVRTAPVPAIPSVPAPVDDVGFGSPLVPVVDIGLASVPPLVVHAELESARRGRAANRARYGG
jgi:hypothetical protein